MSKEEPQARMLLQELSRAFILASWLPGTFRTGAEITGGGEGAELMHPPPGRSTSLLSYQLADSAFLILLTLPIEVRGLLDNLRGIVFQLAAKPLFPSSSLLPTMPLALAPGTKNMKGSLGMQPGRPH